MDQTSENNIRKQTVVWSYRRDEATEDETS